MKKFIYSLALLLAGTGVAGARQLNADESLSNASAYMAHGMRKAPAFAKSAPLSLVKTIFSADGVPTVYLFSGADGKGLLVTPAQSDCPAVLGYADAAFDVNDMPPALEEWLQVYSQEISMVASGQVTEKPVKKAPEYASIAPITKTLWNQNAPYNDLTPTINDSHAVTGCVATAMAQAMKVVEWPMQAQGSATITFNGQQQTLDLSETTLDWANMLDSYVDGGTDAQKEAVALLMRACGYSVNMNYTLRESGAAAANIAPALINNFDYDKGVRYLERGYYTLTDWESIVYGELQAGRPVIYSGVSPAKGGHCFVCDGYSSDSYFHINWGWGGMSDGYFLLTALTPAMQGIGGSTGGFNTDQGITIGLKKPEADSEYFINVVCAGAFTAPATTTGIIYFTSPAFINRSVVDVSGQFGIKCVDNATGEVTYVKSSRTTILKPNYYTTSIAILASELPQGNYTVTPAYYMQEQEKWYDVPVRLDSTQSLQMTNEEGNLSFTATPMDSSVAVTDVTLNSAMYSNAKFSVSATAVNTGEVEYLGSVTGVLIDGEENLIAQADEAPLDLLEGQSQQLAYVSQFTTTPADGTYYFVFVNTQGEVVSEPIEVNITTAPAGTPTLGIRNYDFPTGNGLATPTVPYDNIEVTGEIVCRSGYFAGGVTAYIFPARGGSSLSTVGSLDCFLDEGESQNFDMKTTFANGTVGSRYMIAMFANGSEIPGYAIFTLGAADTGITGVSTDGDELKVAVEGNILTVTGVNDFEGLTIYSLGGAELLKSGSTTADISTLTPGYYIALVQSAGGNRIAKFHR